MGDEGPAGEESSRRAIFPHRPEGTSSDPGAWKSPKIHDTMDERHGGALKVEARSTS